MRSDTNLLVGCGLLWLALADPLLADDPLGSTKPELKAPSQTYPVGPELQKVPLEELEAAYKDQVAPEGIRMYLAIKHGSQMGPGEGWFGPSQSRFSWKELSEKYQFDPEQGWTRDKFSGEGSWFDRLDRNRTGTLNTNHQHMMRSGEDREPQSQSGTF